MKLSLQWSLVAFLAAATLASASIPRRTDPIQFPDIASVRTACTAANLTNLVDGVGASRTVKHQYDACANQTSLTNRNGKVWLFQFDAANRLTNTISPLSRSLSQTWDNRGLLASVKEPSGDAATLTYDARGTRRTSGMRRC